MLADICTIKKVKLTTVNIEDPNSPMSETEVSVGIDIDKVLSGINHEFDSV
jgi:hypothetical protein